LPIIFRESLIEQNSHLFHDAEKKKEREKKKRERREDLDPRERFLEKEKKSTKSLLNHTWICPTLQPPKEGF
jgi:hypothetical protein